MSDSDTLLDAVAVSLDNALYKGGFLVQNDGEARQIAKVAISAIEAAGWRVVPVEPTEEMIRHGQHMSTAARYFSPPELTELYAGMLSAAPRIGEK